MTGMYQTTIGAHNHRSHRDDGYRLPAGVRVISDRMRDAGYFTANVRELPASFGFSGTGKTDWNFTYDGKPFDSSRCDDLQAHQPPGLPARHGRRPTRLRHRPGPDLPGDRRCYEAGIDARSRLPRRPRRAAPRVRLRRA